MVPIGPGTTRDLTTPGFLYQGFTAWLPDGKRIIFAAAEAGHTPRLYLQPLDAGTPVPITAEGIIAQGWSGSAHVLSPDGQNVIVKNGAVFSS